MKQYDIQAIDAVVNIWTPEMLAIRPNRDAFYGGKMKVTQQDLQGISHEEMLRRMDAAGIEKSFLIAAKVGPIMHKASYHTPYEMVAEAINRYPDRFYGQVSRLANGFYRARFGFYCLWLFVCLVCAPRGKCAS
jgi:predicted TIM-barrel fold metal-dependent hydrolase